MKIQYASDLHLEFPENSAFLKESPLVPVGDILILAGDIVPFAVLDKYDDFFSYLSDNFNKTYWIPGNHEYYHFDISDKSDSFIEKIKSNVFLLNNTTVIEENVKFVFSTLWSQISEQNQWNIESRLNDFHVIKNKDNRFSSLQYNVLHKESVAFIRRELITNKMDNTVVVTHHVPTFLNYPEKYMGDALNEAFAVELYDLIETHQPNYWLYGHTHANTPVFKIGKTTLLTNQLGYVKYKENINFNKDKIFNV